MNPEKKTPNPQQIEPPTLGEYNGFEVYPMPFFAVLVANDPELLGRWYQNALGFGLMFMGPVLHLRRRRYQDLLLVAANPSVEATTGGPALTFDADGELDELAARFAKEPPLGRSAAVGPIDTPWNTRELRVTDPVGHRLVFSARRPQPDPTIHAQWQAMFDAQKK